MSLSASTEDRTSMIDNSPEWGLVYSYAEESSSSMEGRYGWRVLPPHQVKVRAQVGWKTRQTQQRSMAPSAARSYPTMAAPTTTTLRILTERSDTKAEAPQAALSTYYFPPYQPPDLDRHPWASPKSNKERRGPTRRKGPVLVVEDDPAILSSVVDIVEFEGYEVESATDGARGLEVLERTTPTLILLDMRMPVLNGWDFARIMKERGISVPVLV